MTSGRVSLHTVGQLTLNDGLDAKVEDVLLLRVRVEYPVKREACLSAHVGHSTAHHLSLVQLRRVSMLCGECVRADRVRGAASARLGGGWPKGGGREEVVLTKTLRILHERREVVVRDVDALVALRLRLHPVHRSKPTCQRCRPARPARSGGLGGTGWVRGRARTARRRAEARAAQRSPPWCRRAGEPPTQRFRRLDAAQQRRTSSRGHGTRTDKRPAVSSSSGATAARGAPARPLTLMLLPDMVLGGRRRKCRSGPGYTKGIRVRVVERGVRAACSGGAGVRGRGGAAS